MNPIYEKILEYELSIYFLSNYNNFNYFNYIFVFYLC
jgi:hypothetical protein